MEGYVFGLAFVLFEGNQPSRLASGPLPLPEAANLASQLFRGLAHLRRAPSSTWT